MSRHEEMAKFFVPENAGESTEHLSPSGAYKLKVTSFRTCDPESKRRTWNYTQGLVFRQGSDEPLFEVRRNYSSFPFLFVEGHPNGHAYLVCGENYQGQTVLELDTGKRRELLPEEAKQGHGFCWASYRFEPTASIIIVAGCFWACPYEFKLYDFSDPMSGWPQIEPEDAYNDDDRRWPTFEPDGTIKFYQSEYVEDNDDDEGEPPTPPIAAIKTFRREGLKLVLVEERVSEKEQKTRAEREEANRKYEEWLDTFKATDPLYLAMLEGVKDPAFKSDQFFSIGQTYEKWCPEFKLNERRICKRINVSPGAIDLEWAAETGPIKVVTYKNDKMEHRFFMEHSVESMRAAIAYAKTVLS
jgi:hypothetical protein